MKPLLREPLVHFILIGAAFFLIDGWLRPRAAPAAGGEIVVSEARVRNIAQTFSRAWQRPPTREELDGLVETYVREEVLYREALALGLDRDDAIIRRRLQQKMEFVTEEDVSRAPPTDAELEAYLEAHAERFRVEPRATFAQVYLDPAARGAALDREARRLRESLERAGAAADFAQAGDRLLLVEPRYEHATRNEVAKVFGVAFADALMQQPVGRWAGPIASGYGMHLVRLEALAPGGVPALDAVRPLVEREWDNAKRQELRQSVYEKLRAKYAIRIDMPGPAAP